MSKLEKFPTNETAQDMLSMISPIYENSYVGKWIFQVMGEDVGKAKKLIINLEKELFPETASWTLPYWEAAYGLEKGDLIPLEERRTRILEKRNSHYPMNPARLSDLLKNRYGRGFEIIEISGTYTFLIKISQGNVGIDFVKLFDFVDRLKPSHISYSAMLDLNDKLNISAGFAVKEYKRIGVTEYTPTDPLIGIDCYADENMVMLSDENGDLLII